MRQSKYFLKTSKTIPADDVSINARLLEQGGFVFKAMAGVYTFLPLGLRVLKKIEAVIREEMDALGASELFMPALQPKENWKKTGRFDSLDILFKVKSIHDYEAALGPTHEEIVTPVVGRWLSSYKDLPIAVYQIQTKFRDEARAKSGLLRGREFRMKDLYSFHTSQEDFEEFYDIVAASYKKVFSRLGLESVYTEASGGSFSKFSHEFQILVPSGEDTIYVCSKCGLAKNKEVYSEAAECTNCKNTEYREEKACEVGNIFPLKTKFSDAFDLGYTNDIGEKNPVYMGCYGIGSSRIMGVLVEKFNDEKGVIWPESVSPFKVHLISLAGKAESVVTYAENLYRELLHANIEVLYDDRISVSAGEKFADSDLFGISNRIVVSAKTITQSSVELKKRNSQESVLVPISGIINSLKE